MGKQLCKETTWNHKEPRKPCKTIQINLTHVSLHEKYVKENYTKEKKDFISSLYALFAQYRIEKPSVIIGDLK